MYQNQFIVPGTSFFYAIMLSISDIQIFYNNFCVIII